MAATYTVLPECNRTMQGPHMAKMQHDVAFLGW
jgi:hypothetical protein